MENKNTLLKRLLASSLFVVAMLNVSSQCDIKNRIGIDGTMYYYLDPVKFYQTDSKQLFGGVVTDKESYFLTLIPTPFPDKKLAEKLKDSLLVKLSNNKQYKLEHFYSRYNKEDSTFRMMFLIDKNSLTDFRNHDVEEVAINMGQEEGLRVYTFRLHKSAIRENLACFIKKKETE